MFLHIVEFPKCHARKSLDCQVEQEMLDYKPIMTVRQLTFPEFHFETEVKVDFLSACI